MRRQIHRSFRKPLIVFTPKSLLRHKKCVSEIEDFSNNNSFHRVLPDHAEDPQYKLIKLAPDKEIKRIVICSGKVYFDLLEKRQEIKEKRVQLVRIEQIYPFPAKTLAKLIKRFVNAEEYIWCQEEPQNQGAWYCSQHHFRAAIPEGTYLTYAGRNASAAPAVGYMSVHVKEQQALVTQALTLD